MKDGTKEISFIIPVRGQWELTENCLRSLAKHSSVHSYEVIVVDNASADATATRLLPLGRALFGESFSLIRNPENRNFGPACNQGARAAASPLLFFLNNDTLLTPGWLPPLLQALRDEAELGAVGPLLLYTDNTVQHLGVTYSSGGLAHLYKGYPLAHPVTGRFRHVQALTGAALLLPANLFFDCGSFCEEYRNGFEDVELSLRLGARGYKLRCVSASIVYHLESRTPGRADHEEHNSLKLKERCLHMLRQDTHLHALRDSFAPALDDSLGVSVLLRESDSADLARQARKYIPDLLRINELLEANPGWLTGYLWLGRLAEESGERELALRYAFMACAQRLSFENIENALRLASIQERNVAKFDATLRELLGKLTRLYSGPDPEIVRLYKKSLATALERGDTEMIRLLEEKEAEIDKNIIRLSQAGQAGQN
ncbi:MAG: glycosyltransferase family 2 protein [Deltaproteobacteria bacterium]|jgi:GT2 family glycosyltransferase|nr:glycosyltransferase family 2 protein [Deltaproteobacteria bacterium]